MIGDLRLWNFQFTIATYQSQVISLIKELTMQKNIRRIGPIVLIIVIIVATIYYLNQVSRNENGPLTASGTVEVVEIIIAPEIVGGQISEVLVEEGDIVHTGDILVRFEDEMLRAQFDQAATAFAQAEANYLLIAAQPLAEQRQVALAAAQLELLSAQQALKSLIDNADLARAHAQQEIEDTEQMLEDLLDPDQQRAIALEAIANAQKAVDEAEKRTRNLNTTASQADIDAAEAEVVLARDVLNKAEEDFKPYADKPEDNLTRANYQARLAAAQQVYDAAVRKLNAISGTGSTVDIAVAEADLATAVAQLEQAQRDYERVKDGPSEADIAVLKAQIDNAKREYEALKDGPDPDDLALAQARVQSAEANLTLAQSDTIQEQLAVAQAQVDSARAALGVIQVQLDKLVLTAPVNGVVLFRSVEPGEVISPGTNAITLGLLDKLTITVYIPEDRYGEVSLGDQVTVKVDSFPNEAFTATVIRIADQAEYTPRNVQTAEGRRTTVFAIDLSVDDPAGKLKPGMPADIEFNVE
jgi:HlyD family secretion protein